VSLQIKARDQVDDDYYDDVVTKDAQERMS